MYLNRLLMIRTYLVKPQMWNVEIYMEPISSRVRIIMETKCFAEKTIVVFKDMRPVSRQTPVFTCLSTNVHGIFKIKKIRRTT
jgi:hypothetical protein